MWVKEKKIFFGTSLKFYVVKRYAVNVRTHGETLGGPDD